jgi:hypothetical protein
MSTVAGWMAIALALCSLAPSFVPGAFSIIGMLMSMLALIISLFSVPKNGTRYFAAAMTIVLAGVVLVNDSLRIWARPPIPPAFRLTLYGTVFIVVAACFAAAWRLSPERRR